MKYLDEYRDGRVAARSLARASGATVTRPWVLMEVCGGQTHSIVRYGIDRMLPPEVELVHGPGCPVCVDLARDDRPGARHRRAARTSSSPRSATCCACPARAAICSRSSAAGADVRVVYAPLDAVRIARDEPGAAGGVLRHRLRDHRARQRHGGDAARGGWASPTSRCWCRTCWCRRPSPPSCRRRATACRRSSAPATSARSWASREYEAHRRALPRPHRGHRLRAGRPARGRADGRAPARGGRRPRSRTSTRAPCGREGNPGARAADRRGLRGRATASGAAWAPSPRAGYRLRSEYRAHDAERLLRGGGHRHRTSPPPASAGWSCAG